jgi:hypothetical protein
MENSERKQAIQDACLAVRTCNQWQRIEKGAGVKIPDTAKGWIQSVFASNIEETVKP